MSLIAEIVLLGLKIYFYIIIIQVVVSWLIAFDVINARNPQAANLLRLLDRATEPVYKPLRKFIPPIGGIDLTPIVVILLIALIENLIYRSAFFH